MSVQTVLFQYALPLEDNIFIKALSFPVMLAKQVFKNKDGSRGMLYLASSDLQHAYDRITTLYQKRWNVEVFHKTIKSDTGLAHSPTRTIRPQSNPFFASIYAFFKLEQLKLKHQLNHFAPRSKLYIKALQAGFAELHRLST
ncbi:MAG: hypothetical protein Q7T96_08435 [Methylobacter sp.]|nr:hypothetical protein [Methylobacter sp.]